MKGRYTSIALICAGVLITLTVCVSVLAAPRAPRPVDWAALNPAFKDATFVKDTSVCLTCHEDSVKAYEQTTHHHAFRAGRTGLEALECESCHGPRSKHVENPGRDFALEGLDADHRS